ncbi:hypothetical protein BH11MYX2_BH11MYX2_41300 [soil metagenome]
MLELSLLRVLLLVSMAIAPLGTHRAFLPRYRPAVHIGALACVEIGLFTPASWLTVAWLLYTAASALLFLRARLRSLFSLETVAAGVPFLFSNVGALWIVGGSNDLHILGYGPDFSYYAALHGTVLGWIMMGCLAILAERDRPRRGVYIAAVFISLVSFLLIAFGIDQLRTLKQYGVIGISIAVPGAQLAFLYAAWQRNRRAFALGCISFAGLVFTMVLAWRNERFMPMPVVEGIRGMISIHGVLNALVIAPCFLAAVSIFARDADR